MSTVAESVDVKSLAGRMGALESEVADLRRQLERLEIQAAIRRGKEQAERGEFVPAKELVASLRAKYNLPTP